MVKVYIASPYTIGDTLANVQRQIDTADQLMNLGYAPFWPLHSHYQHTRYPRPYQDWIEVDLEWVEACDCVLRLPGPSNGADGEVQHAYKNNIPVFYNIADLVDAYN